MKINSIALYSVILISILNGCTSTNIQVPQLTQSKNSYVAEIKQTDIIRELKLNDNQSYDIYDYYNDSILILIYNLDKINPSEPLGAQSNTQYIEKFILFNLSTNKIVNEFELGIFGFCHSAVYAFEGVFFSLVTLNSASIIYLNSMGNQKICDVEATPYDLGPILHRSKDAVIFSFLNSSDNIFGLKKISSDMAVEPLLTFDATKVDFITEEFKVWENHFVCVVGVDNKVTFYLGSFDEGPVEISLAEGEKIHSFDIANDYLILSKEYGTLEEGYFFLEKFDFNGNSIETYPMNQPLYRICANSSGQFCGFYFNSPIELFDSTNKIKYLSTNSSMINSTFNSALSNGKQFVITSYDYPRPSLWQIVIE